MAMEVTGRADDPEVFKETDPEFREISEASLTCLF